MHALRLAALALVIPLGPADKAADKKIPEKVKAFLEKAERFELLSLSPEPQKEKPRDGVQDWKALGKTAIKDQKTRQQILDALEKGIAENRGLFAKCFNPRHAVRATQGGKTVELVICFECAQIYVFVEGRREGDVLLTTKSPQKVLNKILKDANVELADRADE